MSSRAHRLPLTQTGGGFSRWRPDARAPRPKPAAAREDDSPRVEVIEGPSLEEQLAAAYERGVADGSKAAQPLIDAERERVSNTIAGLADLRRAVLDAADQDLVRLAVGMARRVLHREVSLDPDILLAMARVAIGRLGDRVVARVHVNPDDLSAIAASSPNRDGLTLVADAEVPRGGCRVTSEVGAIDLGIDPQMTELSRVLLGDAAEETHVRLH